MMANETLIQVPNNIVNSSQMRKFLLDMVERLDILFGFRGDNSNSLSSLSDALNALKLELEGIKGTLESQASDLAIINNSIEELRVLINNISSSAFLTTELGTDYRDFNFSGYGNLRGYFEFTALGSQISNSPTPLIAGNTYSCYLHSYRNLTNGCIQELHIVTPTTKSFHRRAGATTALMISLGWY